MTLGTITIQTIEYVVYYSRAETNAYLAVDPVRGPTWALLADDDDTRGPFIVSATRRLDLLLWQGSKTNPENVQPNQFARTGLFYPDGTPVSTTDVPVEVGYANALLSGSIAISPTVAEAGGSGSNVKSVKAGSAMVDFFRLVDGVPLQDETAFKLVQQWLESSTASSAVGNAVFGNDTPSTFSDIDQFGLDRGFP